MQDIILFFNFYTNPIHEYNSQDVYFRLLMEMSKVKKNEIKTKSGKSMRKEKEKQKFTHSPCIDRRFCKSLWSLNYIGFAICSHNDNVFRFD